MPFKLLFPYWVMLVIILVSAMVVFSDMWWEETTCWESSVDYSLITKEKTSTEVNWLGWLRVKLNQSSDPMSALEGPSGTWLWKATISRGLALVCGGEWLKWQWDEVLNIHESSKVFSSIEESLWSKWWLD